MGDGWTFGTTQLLTVLGFAITVGIAVTGFRSFSRWRHEQLEGRRMEVAFQALKIAYQAKYVFENIRAPLVYPYEWSKMDERPGESENGRSRRGEFYAVLERINANKAFFQSVWDVQPACMAIFGPAIEETFMELHRARRAIEVACEMLAGRLLDPEITPDPDKKFWRQLRADRCGAEGALTEEGDRVGRQLERFRSGIEGLCRPIIEHRLKGR